MSEDIAPITLGRIFWAWNEEIPWLIEHVRSSPDYAPLRPWSDLAESHNTSDRFMRRFEWGMNADHPDVPLFERLISELDAGRIDREDGKRVLPKWTDGKRSWYAPRHEVTK